MWTWWQHLFTQTSPAANPKAEHWSLRELGQLETQTAWQGSEWYHARLFYIVRRYVEDEWKLRLPSPHQSTTEYLSSACASPAVAQHRRELLGQLLQLGEQTRLNSNRGPSEDWRRLTALARTLLEGKDSAPVQQDTLLPPPPLRQTSSILSPPIQGNLDDTLFPTPPSPQPAENSQTLQQAAQDQGGPDVWNADTLLPPKSGATGQPHFRESPLR